jgi:hypothetical protein
MSVHQVSRLAATLPLVAALAGCVAQPTIAPGSFQAPRSVAVVEVPKVNPLALIGIIVPSVPGIHFTERGDQFFGTGTPPPRVGVNQAGLVAALIESRGEETQKRATEFPNEILKRFPDFDLRADFMKSLRAALDARGIAVSMTGDGQDKALRLRWPALDEKGAAIPSGSAESAPAVDADVLLQVSPIAFFSAPGPLNAYKLNVTVGIAMYEGRTKRFIGRQILKLDPPDSRFEYSRYDSLLEDLTRAAPALRDALLSLVQRVADIASARSAK